MCESNCALFTSTLVLYLTDFLTAPAIDAPISPRTKNSKPPMTPPRANVSAVYDTIFGVDSCGLPVRSVQVISAVSPPANKNPIAKESIINRQEIRLDFDFVSLGRVCCMTHSI